MKMKLKGALVIGALAFAACDDDAGEDRLVDAGNVDAKVDVDAHTKPDASTNDGGSCSLDQALAIYSDGGLSEYRSTYSLSADGRFSRKVSRDPRPGDTLDSGVGGAICFKDLPACGSAQVDLADVRAALSAAEVGAAWGDGTTVLGKDDRAVDNQVLIFARADGKKIVIGLPCGTAAGCTPIPPAVEALRTLFNKLLEEQPLGPQGDGGTGGLCPK